MMIRKIEISELKKQDEKIKEIYRRALHYSEASADFLLTRMTNSENRGLHPLILGSFEGDTLVGFVFGFDFHPQNWWAQQIDKRLPKDFNWYHSTFEINELAVLPSHQGQGRGKKLMEELLLQLPHQCALLGTKKENNDHVIRLYQRLGFRVVIDSFRYSEDSPELSLIMGRKGPVHCL